MMVYWDKDRNGNWFLHGGVVIGKPNRVERKSDSLNVKRVKLTGGNGDAEGIRKDEGPLYERGHEQECGTEKSR